MVWKAAAMVCLLTGLAVNSFATPAPEIDPANGANALALLGGIVLVVRSRTRRK